ncbi:RIO1 family domain-containing protein, putative [Eimeria necatrix]|uniref:Serine/threonine-protein kinase RIO2 n=1 Tax=Eimeria necatrix TaxID=51315 RepID=U6MRP3_9EIME|nr:RIO1 family domain-containing protein, putative [Eimeria necatrix]CDJ66671.1 RIO1 family domain-containing protein, putative [Eimeria necatrix]
MRLQADVLRYMTKGEFRVLTAVEMGMKNHEFVSSALIEQIAGLRRHSIRQILSTLLKNKLVFHSSKSYDGYKMTYLGYDYLALNAFVKRGLIKGVGVRVGVGKESDIHVCEGTDGKVLILKLHRLGRISFRSIKKNRDYMQHRMHCSWHYLAHLAAVREFAYLKALHSHGFPVPEPVDMNRHAVLMEYIDAIPLTQVRELKDPFAVLEKLMKLIVRLAHCGLIHGDFNEFNLMIDDAGHITMIDLPQMVSIYHRNAAAYFDRDVQCIKRLFERKFLVEVTTVPKFDEVVEGRGTKLSSAADGTLDDGHAEGAADGEESSCNLISVSDDLDEHQAELLEGALAARRNNETESSCSDESEIEDEEESCGSAKPQESSEEEAQEEEEQSASDAQDESPKRECKSDDDSQEASSASDSEEAKEGATQPLPLEEQQALIHCWRPTARSFTLFYRLLQQHVAD